ncbi:MAG: carbohydrate-binding domain-containing protein [Bacteroidales bacterium]|nr:carbohydrate-binding domain-containing protein [Bacteroidales bacterium]
MKKLVFPLAFLVLIGTGCAKDNPWNNSGDNTANNGAGSTSGVTGSTTAEIYEDEEDMVDNTQFVRTISIVFSESGSATVTGDDKAIVTVNGNKVIANNTSTKEKVKYELSGSTSNGYFKVYSDNKQAIVLNSVSITNPNGAAINNQGHKRCFVIVNGTSTLADGSSYTETPADEDEKAAFFSEGQLIFSGSGTLNVTAKGKSGITSDDYVRIVDAPTINVSSSAGHALRGKDAVIINGGALTAQASAHMKKGVASDSLVLFNGGVTTINVTGGVAYDDDDKEYKSSAGVKADQLFVMNAGSLTITNTGQGGKGISGDGPGYFQGGTVDVSVTGSNYGRSSSDNSKSAKGIKFDGNIYISAGSVSSKAANHEAIESKGKIEITGGTVYAQSKDDAINSAAMMAITGGSVCAYSTGNDGLDANGNLYIEGGVVYAIGAGSPEVAVDANTEGGYKLYVNGGVLFAIGGLENGAVLSQSCYQSTSWNKGTWYSMSVGNKVYSFKTPSSGGNGLVVSAPSQPGLYSGTTPSGGTGAFNGMAVFDGSYSGGNAVSLSTYTSQGGMGGPGGGGGGRPGGGGGRP